MTRPRLAWWCVPVAVFAALAASGDHTGLDLYIERIGAHQLFTRAGLHVYADHPVIQVGPLALAVIRGVDVVSFGRPLVVATLAAGLILIRLLTLVARLREGEDPAKLIVGGVLVAVAWVQVVPETGHLDDLLAVTFSIWALERARASQSVAAGLLLGLAVGCKPWALLAVPVLLLASRRHRALLALSGVLGATWLPFLLAAPGTLRALSTFRVAAAGSSLPGLLGDATSPWWVRPSQLLLALSLAAVAARRRAWWSLLLAAFAARVVLDAGTYSYYDAGVVVGAYVADVATRIEGATPLVRRLPAATAVTTAGLLVSDQLRAGDATYALRVAACLLPLVLTWYATPPGHRQAPTPLPRPDDGLRGAGAGPERGSRTAPRGGTAPHPVAATAGRPGVEPEA